MAAPSIIESLDETVDTATPPPRKRARQHGPATKSKEPRLFAPFRALGLITNHVPFTLQTRSFKGASEGPRIHILTCLGKSWALWDGQKMTLLFVGTDAEHPISCLEMDGDSIWAATGPHVIQYHRGKEVKRLTNPLESHIAFITVFGSRMLALVQDGSRMLSWNMKTSELETTIPLDPGFIATTILHPATYVNKVLLASAQGTMQLWNIQSQTCLYKFTPASFKTTSTSSTSDASVITALTQSPAIDVVGIGFMSGEILVHDIRTDERMMRMFMVGGGVRALGFRSDGHATLASVSSSGDLAIWDLNEGGRLLHTVRGAHDGAITAVHWVPGQPLLVTSGEDNSVKQWLFDSPTAAPRLLKLRSGHHAPPHLIRYYGEDGKQILTASRDRSLRCTSVVRDSRSFEMSQGSLTKKANLLSLPLSALKFPPITAVSYSSSRSKDWDDILTAHTDETFARTWTMQSKRLGKHTLGFAEDAKSKGKEKRALGSVKAVCVSACGNFGVASSSNGLIHMWNMQSGIKRRSFDVGPCPPDVTNRFRLGGKKTSVSRSITGLSTDALNTLLIATTLDGTINFFDFTTAKLDQTVVLPSSVVSIQLQQNSGLLAVSCDDMVIRILDIETRRIVRELHGFKGRILDFTFSPDSRWILTTSLDSIIRTFDIPTGRLIDAFKTSSVASSLSFSPTSDFLATSHVDSVGVFLWANRAQYGDITFQTVREEDIEESALPVMQGEEEDQELAGLSALVDEKKTVDVFTTPTQLDGELVTLTLLPRARWQTLINLDVIQQRNKPKEPPKAPEKAPFFLPTLPGVEGRFLSTPAEDKSKETKKTRRLELNAARTESVFLNTLSEDDQNGNYEALFSHAKALSPAALELEIRSIVSLEHHLQFTHALKQRLLSHRDFEAVQAMLKVLLTIHADLFIENVELADALALLKEVEKKESDRVVELVAASLGTLGFVRDTL